MKIPEEIYLSANDHAYLDEVIAEVSELHEGDLRAALKTTLVALAYAVEGQSSGFHRYPMHTDWEPKRQVPAIDDGWPEGH